MTRSHADAPPPKEWQCRDCGERRWFKWAPTDADRCNCYRPGALAAGWIAVELFEALKRERENRQAARKRDA